jgi:glycosyltransferase involved in cell wall biosynthesis
MGNGALVTTIIPVFNRPALLAEAVGSVLDQTYRPIEIIIVDDGSTDDTPAVADDLAARHHEVIRTIHIVNGGPGLAREAGRLAARGDYIQHLDSDDLLLPRKFEAQVAALEASPECGAAYGWTRFRHQDGHVEPTPWKRSGERIETMFPAMLTMRWWDTPTPLYRASLIAAAGPWTSLRIEEDWEYDCRMAARGVRLAWCAEWVCEVRAHEPVHLIPAMMRDRARSHMLVLEHAHHAGLDPQSPPMQQFARELFHIGRQCGAAGLVAESQQLLEKAREISDGRDMRAYEFVARHIGWRNAGRASAWLDRLRHVVSNRRTETLTA